MHRSHWLLALLGAALLAGGARAQEDATSVGPPFHEGDVLGFEQLDQLKGYLPVEFWNNRDFFFFEGMQLEIGPAHYDYSPAEAHKRATERFKGQARIGPEGSLENYTAGTPFPMEDFDCKGDPQAGVKFMWNFERRWSGGGGEARFLYTYWDRGEKLPLYYEGTGRGIPMAYRVEPEYLDEQHRAAFEPLAFFGSLPGLAPLERTTSAPSISAPSPIEV